MGRGGGSDRNCKDKHPLICRSSYQNRTCAQSKGNCKKGWHLKNTKYDEPDMSGDYRYRRRDGNDNHDNERSHKHDNWRSDNMRNHNNKNSERGENRYEREENYYSDSFLERMIERQIEKKLSRMMGPEREEMRRNHWRR